MNYGHKVSFEEDKANVVDVRPVYSDQHFNGVEVEDLMLGSTLSYVELYLNSTVKGFYGRASQTTKFLTGVWESTGYDVANVYTGKNTSLKVVFADEAYEDADFTYDDKSMDKFYTETREYLAKWTVNNYKESHITETIKGLYDKLVAVTEIIKELEDMNVDVLGYHEDAEEDECPASTMSDTYSDWDEEEDDDYDDYDDDEEDEDEDSDDEEDDDYDDYDDDEEEDNEDVNIEMFAEEVKNAMEEMNQNKDVADVKEVSGGFVGYIPDDQFNSEEELRAQVAELMRIAFGKKNNDWEDKKMADYLNDLEDEE